LVRISQNIQNHIKMDDFTFDKLDAMKYRQLQQLAQERGVKANGKKQELIARLLETLVKNEEPVEELNSVPTKNDEEAVDLNDTFVIDDNKLANSTYLMTANSPSAIDDLFLSADDSILAGNLNLNATKTLSTENQENVVVKPVESVIAKKPESGSSARPSRTQIPRIGINSARFTESHKRMFAKMPSIADTKAILESKHKKNIEARSEVVNRLAAAKQPRDSIRRAGTSATPSISKFKTNPIKKSTPMPLSSATNKRSRPISHSEENVINPKQPKKDHITPVRELSLSRIEQLAVPKSAGSVPISKERRSYTPNKTRYEYVDTTRLSDSEFRAYQQRQKEQEPNRSIKKIF